jgi:hypothetical protein
VNLFVKNDETSSPREAISAISSAVFTGLDVLGIDLLLLLGRLPGGNQMVVLSFSIAPYLENHRAETVNTPSDGTKLFWIVTLPVHHVYLVKNLLHIFKTDAVLPLDLPALLPIEFKTSRNI